MGTTTRRALGRIQLARRDGSIDRLPFPNVLADDFKFRGSLGQQTVGRDGWRGYRDQVRAAAPDFNELVELVVDGDRAAARLRCVGTHRGLLLGLAGAGRAFAYDAAAFFRAQGGQLVQAWVLGDLSDLRRQRTGRQ